MQTATACCLSHMTVPLIAAAWPSRCEGVLHSHRHVEPGLHHGGAHPEFPSVERQMRDRADQQDLFPSGYSHQPELAQTY